MRLIGSLLLEKDEEWMLGKVVSEYERIQEEYSVPEKPQQNNIKL